MQFRAMRRIRQQLLPDECEDILRRNTSGTLAVLGDGGYPYAVPLSYVYMEGKLYFHCARTGHKLDAVRSCDKVSFCVIDRDVVVPEEYATYYRSVIVFGRAHIVTDEAEIRRSLEGLAVKYAPGDSAAHRKETMERELPALYMVRVEIEHMSGKEAKGLAAQREQ